jgi:hypothetical protein
MTSGPLETTPASDLPARLRSGYEQLTQVDQALRDAEQRLLNAHVQPGRDGARAQEVYLEVLSLRDRSRRVLDELAEVWAGEG